MKNMKNQKYVKKEKQFDRLPEVELELGKKYPELSIQPA